MRVLFTGRFLAGGGGVYSGYAGGSDDVGVMKNPLERMITVRVLDDAGEYPVRTLSGSSTFVNRMA
ncbi:MAG TPA: hypothetical protein PLR71_10320 [Deltaproteobacteria bacterium]|nr:hypothetical protein [Deltaproteobacteria bacterium]